MLLSFKIFTSIAKIYNARHINSPVKIDLPVIILPILEGGYSSLFVKLGRMRSIYSYIYIVKYISGFEDINNT